MVRRDRNVANRVAIERVPTVFVGNDRIAMAGDYDQLIKYVEEQIQRTTRVP